MTEQEKITITKYDLYYETRMSKAETSIENLEGNFKEIKQDIREIRSDLRWMLGVWVSINGIMMGLMAHGFKWF